MSSIKILLKAATIFVILETCFAQNQRENCQKCNARFSNLTDCLCKENQYCDTKTKHCSECDHCFHFWNNKIQNIRLEGIEPVTNNILESYFPNIPDVEKLIATLDKKKKTVEDQIKELKNNNERTKNIIKENEKNLKKLNDDLEELKRKLSDFGKSNSTVSPLLKDILDLSNEIKELLNTFKTINSDFKPLNATESRLNKVAEGLKRINSSWPDLRENSLNLALEVENEIEELELILKQYNNNINGTNVQKFNTSIISINNEIEELLVFFMEKYRPGLDLPSEKEVADLVKRAKDAENKAKDINGRLKTLTEAEKDFLESLKNLKKDLKNLKDVKRLKDLFVEIDIEANKTVELYSNFSRKMKGVEKKVNNEYNKLGEEFDGLEKEIKNFKNEMNMEAADIRLMEQEDLFQGLQDSPEINTLNKEVDDLIKEIKVYTKHFIEYCKVTT